MNDRFYSCAKAFVATVRTGSMSAAALELKTTKSAISQKLAFFEAELGLTLLDRSGRSATPTASGKRIFEACIIPVDAALEAEANLGLIRADRVAGRVSISGPNSLLGMIFVPTMAVLQKHYPDIELELHADDSKGNFHTDDIDLAIRTGTPAKGRHIANALRPAQRGLFASPDFLSHHQPIAQPEDPADIPCILRQQETEAWSFKNATNKHQTVAPCVGLRVNTMELAHAATRAGHGVAMLPCLLAEADVKTGVLVSIIPDWIADPVSVSLLCRAARLSAPPVVVVRRHILGNCSS